MPTNSDEEEEFMLHENRRRPSSFSQHQSTKKRFKIILAIIGVLLVVSLVTLKNSDNGYLDLKTYAENINSFKENIKKNNENNFEVEGFMPLFVNNTKGPITTNRTLDDGQKYNLFDKIIENNEEDFNSFYYDISNFLSQPENKKGSEEYICESAKPYENKGFYLTCPNQYSVIIDDAFFGRHADDDDHCAVDDKGNKISKSRLQVEKECGKSVKENVQKICNGKKRCRVLATTSSFGDSCPGFIKYVHLKYHCYKNKQFQKPKFAVVMYSDIIKPNSIYEHAISEFYQYSNIHGYKFILNTNKYDDEREVFYMKLYVVQEAIMNGLKNKEYDWVFWVDGDVMLANPNIKLETFLPEDDDVHLVIASDHHGLNAGVFLIRVHSWSLNFMARSIAYQYNNIDKPLMFADQTSINNVLLESKEQEHYVLVPQSWFNTYPDKRHGGEMILHFAGRKDKAGDLSMTHRELDNDPNYLKAITNRKLRKEVLEYYNKPRNEHVVSYADNDITKEKFY